MQDARTALSRPSTQLWLALGMVVLAVLAAVAVPNLDRAANPGASRPGVVSFLGVGLAALMLTMTALYAGMRQLLPRTAVFAVAAVGYSALLIGVKFLLSPLALYAFSEGKGLIILNSDPTGFAYFAFPAVALVTASLYGTAFFILYAYFQSKLRARLGIPVGFESRFVALYVVMFVLGAMSGVTLGLFATLEYLSSFLFSIGLGVLLAFALLGALVLCTVAFSEASQQAALLRNVTLLTGFAWVGLAFIAAYHVVWLVFILTLITLWPLKSLSVK